MLSEYRKSINAILFERVTSPFFGAFFFSWLAWNWRIVYLTFLVDSSELKITKIDFIVEHYSGLFSLVYGPLLSTLVILVIIPILSNGAYWVHLLFKRWRVNKKNKVEGKQLLTWEQSVSLKKELRRQEREYEELLNKKDEEIKDIESQLFQANEDVKEPKGSKETSSLQLTYREFRQHAKPYSYFKTLVYEIHENHDFPGGITPELKEYYLINKIVEKSLKINSSRTYYHLTYLGEELYRQYLNHNI